jgi:hypothetical protein
MKSPDKNDPHVKAAHIISPLRPLIYSFFSCPRGRPHMQRGQILLEFQCLPVQTIRDS